MVFLLKLSKKQQLTGVFEGNENVVVDWVFLATQGCGEDPGSPVDGLHEVRVHGTCSVKHKGKGRSTLSRSDVCVHCHLCVAFLIVSQRSFGHGEARIGVGTRCMDPCFCT